MIYIQMIQRILQTFHSLRLFDSNLTLQIHDNIFIIIMSALMLFLVKL